MTPTGISVERAIEVAEHNGWWEDGGTLLVVWDSLCVNRYRGTRLEVGPAAKAVGGWWGRCRDGVGRSCHVYRTDKLEAATDALDGYLHIANFGI